jgi:murein DD-endopeptidase MepM/ murein hydrolase activator NlpD
VFWFGAAAILALVVGSPGLAASGRAWITHEVKRSETLGGIASQYGISVRQIVAANRLPSASAPLLPGRVLTIPEVKGVRPSDSGKRVTAKRAVGSRPPAVRRASLRSTSVPDIALPLPANLVLAVPEFEVPVPEFAWPVEGAVSSRFGRRGGNWHRGVDIAAAEGTPIYAAAPGVVVASGIEPRYGQVVKIEHDGGFVTVYAHNLANSVEVGTRVIAGQEVATVGRTGQATSAHVHFEIRHEGRVVNPLYLLPLPARVATEEFAAETGDEDE